MVDPAYTDLILANAIYFKGRWLNTFDKKLTKERPFHPAVGVAKNLPMMSMWQKLMYQKGSGYQAVRLPYIGGDLAMYVFLPDPGMRLATLLQLMNGDKWRRQTLPDFNEREGTLVLPRFKLDNMLSLNAALKSLGMKTAFDRQKADFSEMFEERHNISDVRQKAFVEINEEGTVAAAVTKIEVETIGVQENRIVPFDMIVDRPFMFVVAHAPSEMILFMGVVNDL
jgi:serpin B